MQVLKRKKERIAAIITILFHALLILLFLFNGLTKIVPRPQQGILINFGTSDQGEGMVQPDQAGQDVDKASQTNSNTPSESSSEAAIDDKVLTQDDQPAPAVKTNKKKEPSPEEIKDKKEKETREELSRLFNKWESGGQKGGSQGTTGQPGDQGDVNGSKESNNMQGGSGANGVSFSLSGRGLVAMPAVQDKSQNQGKVVVDIIVDRQGNVISAIPGGRGSTTTNAHLYKLSKDAALKAQFSANQNARVEQKGTMTFIYVLN